MDFSKEENTSENVLNRDELVSITSDTTVNEESMDLTQEDLNYVSVEAATNNTQTLIDKNKQQIRTRPVTRSQTRKETNDQEDNDQEEDIIPPPANQPNIQEDPSVDPAEVTNQQVSGIVKLFFLFLNILLILVFLLIFKMFSCS